MAWPLAETAMGLLCNCLVVVSSYTHYVIRSSPLCGVNPFSTAVPFWGHTIQLSSSLPPKRDCGPKGIEVFPAQK